MPMWGDPDHDWKGIDDACSIIERRLRFWRVPVYQVKEKFGSVRVYCSLGWSSLHDICYPGHACSRFPGWLWRLDCSWTGNSNTVTGWLWRQTILRLSVWLHKKAYRSAYKKAVRRHPDLAQYILEDADFSDLLVGIVPVDKCKHESEWLVHNADSGVTVKCAICGRERNNSR